MGPMCCVSVHGSALQMGPVCCVSVHGSAIQMGPVCCISVHGSAALMGPVGCVSVHGSAVLMGPVGCVSVHGSAIQMGTVFQDMVQTYKWALCVVCFITQFSCTNGPCVLCVSVHGSAVQMGPVCCVFQYTVQLVKDSSVQHLKEVLARKTGVQTSNVSLLAAMAADGPRKHERALRESVDFVCESAKHLFCPWDLSRLTTVFGRADGEW